MRDGPAAALETGLVGALLGDVMDDSCVVVAVLGRHIWGAGWDARRVNGSWE